jgi:uncharacterized protein DUF4129
MPARGTPTGAGARQAAAALLVLAIAVVGLRAGGSFSAVGSARLLYLIGRALYWVIIAVGGLLVARELVAIAAWLLWARGRSARVRERRRRSPWWLLVVIVEVAALAKILAWLRQHQAAARVQASHGAGHPRVPGWHGLLPPGSSWPLLMALTIAAVLAAALVTSARRAAHPRLPPGPGLAAVEPLVQALAAGAGALADDPDPRAAIVGCYAAMERSLASAGAPPQAADTPAQVLDRASAEGLVQTSAAGTLTALFRRARYSTHTMTEADRDAARHALTELQADLAGVRRTPHPDLAGQA